MMGCLLAYRQLKIIFHLFFKFIWYNLHANFILKTRVDKLLLEYRYYSYFLINSILLNNNTLKINDLKGNKASIFIKHNCYVCNILI